jgi:hypothetical protein
MDSDKPRLCERCQCLQLKCIKNGPCRACNICRVRKKTCSLTGKTSSSGLPPTKAQALQRSTAAARQPPPPPPTLNPPAALLSHQVAQLKRKQVVNNAGKGGLSKIRKVRIMVRPPTDPKLTAQATISVKEEEASVKLPTVRVLRAPVQPGSQPGSVRVTPSAEGEKLRKFILLIVLTYLIPYSCSRQ